MKSTITCILATNGDLVKLKRSIECFIGQSHSKKQLLILSNAVLFINEAIRRHLEEVNDENITFATEEDRDLPNEALQYKAAQMVNGDLICLWDENYQYHERRLEIQLSFLSEKGADAVFLVEELQLFEQDQILFVTDWTQEESDVLRQLIPETLMMTRNRGLRFPTFEKGIIDDIVQQKASISGLSGEVGLVLRHVQEYTAEQKNNALQKAIKHSGNKEKTGAQISFLLNILNQYWVPTPLGIYSGKQQIGIYSL